MNSFELAKEYFLEGCALLEAEDYSQAESNFKKSLELIPDRASTLTNLSVAQLKLKKYSDARASAQKAIASENNNCEAYLNLGLVEKDLKNFEISITFFDKALSLKGNYVEALSNKGGILHELKRYDEAIANYDKALSLKPDYAEGWSNRGNALHALKRYDEAIANYDKALSLKPDYAEGWANKGEILNVLKRHSESAKCYQKALEFNAKDSYLLGKAHHQMMLGCDWTNYEKYINEIFYLVNQGRMVAEPFGFQGISSSDDLSKKCAEIYSNNYHPPQGALCEFIQYKHHKIRIGYLCGEFRNQATSSLMTRVWELHDKSKFEIYAFDNGWNDGSEYRQRIEEAFSKIFDISKLSDANAAKLIQAHEIDILINLNGFFGLARQGVFSYKPAPIQVNYLGFPGTIGAKYMDYIIADRVVIPKEFHKFYVEKIAYLPNSYQPNDDLRKISHRKFMRSQLGLPESAFIFACFNNNYKITPTTFNSWMRILYCVPGSILWLLADNPTAKENLKKEAVKRGIAANRLIFAERLPISEHLARHYLADLFLDTLPYNAHTTCSDALWAGLPVLTLLGSTFPGRVAASLLSAIGLPELITKTQEDYEALAIELAMNPAKLANLKLKLANNRLSAPLFDTPLFTKNLEDAYLKMYERYLADLEPAHIEIS